MSERSCDDGDDGSSLHDDNDDDYVYDYNEACRLAEEEEATAPKVSVHVIDIVLDLTEKQGLLGRHEIAVLACVQKKSSWRRFGRVFQSLTCPYTIVTGYGEQRLTYEYVRAPQNNTPSRLQWMGANVSEDSLRTTRTHTSHSIYHVYNAAGDIRYTVHQCNYVALHPRQVIDDIKSRKWDEWVRQLLGTSLPALMDWQVPFETIRDRIVLLLFTLLTGQQRCLIAGNAINAVLYREFTCSWGERVVADKKSREMFWYHIWRRARCDCSQFADPFAVNERPLDVNANPITSFGDWFLYWKHALDSIFENHPTLITGDEEAITKGLVLGWGSICTAYGIPYKSFMLLRCMFIMAKMFIVKCCGGGGGGDGSSANVEEALFRCMVRHCFEPVHNPQLKRLFLRYLSVLAPEWSHLIITAEDPNLVEEMNQIYPEWTSRFAPITEVDITAFIDAGNNLIFSAQER